MGEPKPSLEDLGDLLVQVLHGKLKTKEASWQELKLVLEILDKSGIKLNRKTKGAADLKEAVAKEQEPLQFPEELTGS